MITIDRIKAFFSKNNDRPSGFTDKQGRMLTVAELKMQASESRKKWLSGFGFKMCWYMVKEGELKARGWSLNDFANAIGLEEQRFLSWNEGVSYVYSSRGGSNVFITPALNGWVYVLNFADELDLLDGILESYYAFGSYRVVDYVSWKQVEEGQVVRYFQYADGRVYHNIGVQTEQEAELTFIDITGLDNEHACEAMFSQAAFNNPDITNIADEEDVMALCKAWTGQDLLVLDTYPINSVTEQGVSGVLLDR